MKHYKKEAWQRKKMPVVLSCKKKMKINGDSQRNPQFDHGYVGKFIFLRQHLASKETLKSFIEQVVSNG